MKRKLKTIAITLILSMILVSTTQAAKTMLLQKVTVTTNCNPLCYVVIEYDYGIVTDTQAAFTEEDFEVCIRIYEGDRLCR